MTKSSADLRSPLIARRMDRVASFLAMDVLSAAAAKERRGDSVIHMEVGQPSAPAPRAAREAAKAALDLFLSSSKVIPQPDALFRDDWQERINTFLHNWLRQRQLGLNLLTGINGQFSLGHSAFFALGAYTAAIMMDRFGIAYYWTLPVAGIVSLVFGFLFGVPSLRLAR